MKKILWIGDGPDCPSGFGRATREIVDVLRHSYDVTILGMNYRGDPSTVPYVVSQQVPVYAAGAGGDSFGVGRLIWMCDLVKPDAIFIQQDGWNYPHYIKQLVRFAEYINVPVVGSVAIDGKNFQGSWLDGISSAIFWTQFALDEARDGGYAGPATVIPLGVDAGTYRPGNRREARVRHGFPDDMLDGFLIGNVNRNQPRKRWDLTVRYFAEWVRSRNISDAWLCLHTAPTGDMGYSIQQLTRYYGVEDRVALIEPPTWYGVAEEKMRDTYNCFDVQVSTTQGEGFGLTTLEGMACGIPQIVPDWSGLGSWAKGAAYLIPCSSTAIGPPYVNVIGGVPDEAEFVKALETLYSNKTTREFYGFESFKRACQPEFLWSNIGQRYVEVLGGILEPAATMVLR